MLLLSNNNQITTLIFFLFVWLASSTSSAASPNYNDIYCPNNKTYEPNSTIFNTNLNVVLFTLVSNATQGADSYSSIMGFGTTNAVNGVFLCRGDVSSTTCQDCVTTAATNITRLCPNQTESIIWYDECMLRYTSRYFSPTSLVPRLNLKNNTNISISTHDLVNYNQLLLSFLGSLATEASDSQTQKKFATGEETFDFRGYSKKVVTVYGLAQCVPGVTNVQCEECLVNALRSLDTCCEGARALLAWCNIRYDLYRFYNTTGGDSASPPDSPSSGNLTL